MGNKFKVLGKALTRDTDHYFNQENYEQRQNSILRKYQKEYELFIDYNIYQLIIRKTNQTIGNLLIIAEDIDLQRGQENTPN